jgi:MCM N-terminal domain
MSPLRLRAHYLCMLLHGVCLLQLSGSHEPSDIPRLYLSAANKQSLEVSYAHLSQACPILAVWVADVPKQMFAMFNEVAHQVCAAVLEH